MGAKSPFSSEMGIARPNGAATCQPGRRILCIRFCKERMNRMKILFYKGKKFLRSALILLMVLLVGTTTLTQAYASYASIKIEHVWVDETGGAETEPSEPETKPSEPETKPSEPETKPSGAATEPSESETEPSESETEPSESETEPSESETEPSEPDSEADEADKADGEEPEKAGVSLDELEIKHTISSDHFAADMQPVHKEVEKNVSSSTSTKEQFTGEDALNKLKEMGLEDLYNAAPEASEEDASDGEQDHTEIKEQVQEQLQTLTDSEDLDTVMAEEDAEELAEVIAEEISESVEQVIGIEVWKTDNVANLLMSSKDTNTNQLLQMSEESEKRIEEAGYTENSLKITIVVINGIEDRADNYGRIKLNPDVEYRKTYVSTDNGETWTLIGMTDPDGNAVDTATLALEGDAETGKTSNPVGEGEVVESYLYTYLHVKPKPEEPKPEEPKPEDPKPEDPKPEDPKPEDPRPETPRPTPIPVIPNEDVSLTEVPEEDVPLTDIPEEDVPLTDIPEEDVPLTDIPDEGVPLEEVPEEEPEEVDIPDEDVPLSEIPKTGDSSFLWLCTAVFSGAALLVLTRRTKEQEA